MKQNRPLMVSFVFLIVISLFLTVKLSAKEVAPNFTLTDIDGNEFSLSDYRGKIVLLDFFRAVGCPPCISEIPHLKAVHEEFGEDLIIISISYESVATLQEFRDNYQIDWKVAKDTAGVSNNYNVQYVPTLVIIDKYGYTSPEYRHVGLTEESDLSSEINELIAQDGNGNGNGNGDGNGGTENGDASPGFPVWLAVMLVLFVAAIIVYIIFK